MTKQLLNWEKFRSSFGLSCLVSENAVVYYHVIFNSHLLGTVSDLLAFQLKKEGMDEFKLRALLVFLVLPAYQNAISRNQGRSLFRWGVKENLEYPFLLECAVDSFLFTIGISFSYGSHAPFQTAGMIERIRTRRPQSSWEQVLIDLDRFSEKVILKIAPQLNKVELVLLIKRGRQQAERIPQVSAKLSEFELIVLVEKDIPSGPPPKCYVSLGDLDYSKVIKPLNAASEAQGFKEADESDVKIQSTAPEESTRIRIHGSPEKSELSTMVHGAQREAEAATRIKGTTERIQTWIRKTFSWRQTAKNVGESQPGGMFEIGEAKSQAKAVPVKEADIDEAVQGTEELSTGRKVPLSAHEDSTYLIKYKSAVDAARQELKKKEVELHQRNGQIQVVTRQLEKFKEEIHVLKHRPLDSDVLRIRTRNDQLEKMVISSKDENGQLVKMVDRLKEELRNSKTAMAKEIMKEKLSQPTSPVSPKSVQISGSDEPGVRIYQELLAKFNAVSRDREIQTKRMDELKKANQNLMEHLNDPKPEKVGVSTANAEKMRARLEASMQLVAKTRKEASSLKDQMTFLQEENEKLKARAAELQTLLKSEQTMK